MANATPAHTEGGANPLRDVAERGTGSTDPRTIERIKAEREREKAARRAPNPYRDTGAGKGAPVPSTPAPSGASGGDIALPALDIRDAFAEEFNRNYGSLAPNLDQK